ncbi:MAG: alpha/beta hydrolase fold domain-containing protein [Candidatus Lokiarchaeota archaeon]|nr:alpha/beta hydrolase fold domain-containing protein [Candidatus Lokiarchaeota archaeon]
MPINLVKSRNITVISYITATLDLFCIAFGILFILKPLYSLLWDIFGVVLVLTIFVNLFFIYFTLYKKNILRVKTQYISYGFLLFIIIAVPCMMLGNLLLSVIYSNNVIDTVGAYLLLYLGYFGIFVYGFVFALFELKLLSNIDLYLFKYSLFTTDTVRHSRIRNISRKILVILSRITFIFGIVFAIVIMFGSFEVVTTFIAIVSGQFGTFFSIIFLANTLLLLKLKRRKRTTKKYYRTALIGFFVSGCLLMPLFVTNTTVRNAENTFSIAFGNDWKAQVPSGTNDYFLQTPFSLTNYFLGSKPKASIIQINTLFYNNEGISLYFDAYKPLNSGEILPGENSVLIRIHGGSWVSGDKGMMNMLQMNKYFASQGYVVFDIQYGLDRNPLFELDPLTPEYKKGNFNIDDMMRHIGIFTQYLVLHADEYGANLDSVFVSGGSAGGHLASAVALAIASGNYTDIFGTGLTIKGLIPFYPANGQMVFFGISGSDEFKNPEKLIDQNSPPCLIFQGTHDILNYFSISEKIRDIYRAKGNRECAILWMPFGGHASDFYFTGYYNQIFLYFMERFMFLYH